MLHLLVLLIVSPDSVVPTEGCCVMTLRERWHTDVPMADRTDTARVSASAELAERDDSGLLTRNNALQPHKKLRKAEGDRTKLEQWFFNEMQAQHASL